MGHFSVIPTSFEEWVPLLRTKADDVCSGLTFKHVEQQVGRGIFEDLQYTKASQRLVDVISGDKATTSYLNTRWYVILALIIAILMLVFSLVSTSLVNLNIRERFARWTDDIYPPKVRRTQSRLITGNERGRLFWLSAVFGSGILLAAIYEYYISAQIVESINAVNCNVWQMFRVHFDGPKGVDRGGNEEISVRWLGTNEMQETLKRLHEETLPGDENLIAAKLYDGLHELEMKANKHNETMADILGRAWALIDVYDEEIKAINKNISDSVKLDPKDPNAWPWRGYEKGYEVQVALRPLFQRKSYVLVTEVNSTLVESYDTISRLIKKYTNATSDLMKEAHEAVEKSQSTIREIDTAFGNMVSMWEKHGTGLVSLINSNVAFGIIGATVGAIAVFLVIYLSWDLGINLRQDRKKPNVTLWKIAFCFCSIATGLSAFGAALNMMTAVIGRDACDVIDNDLLEKGKWNMLGDKILNPSGGLQGVDIPLVFDTCVRRDGSGAIGETIGFSDAINKVSSKVDDAILEIDDTAEQLLDENARKIRVKTLKYVMEEALKALSHTNYVDRPGKHAFGASNNGRPSFNELANLSFESHLTETDGRRIMLSLLPLWNESMLKFIGTNGFFSSMGTVRDGYEFLNRLSKVYHERNSTGVFPKAFCGELAKAQGQPCAEISGAVMLNTLTADNVTSLVADMDEIMPTYDHYDTQIANRTVLLIEALRFMERFGTWKSKTPYFAEHTNCTKADDKLPCTFDAIRQTDVASLTENAENLLQEYLTMNNEVHAYVNDLVKPTLRDVVRRAQSLVDDANCQNERTSLEYGVYQPLCYSTLPGVLVSGVAMIIATVLLALLSVFTWLWTHYVIAHDKDLEDEFAAITACPEYDQKSV